MIFLIFFLKVSTAIGDKRLGDTVDLSNSDDLRALAHRPPLYRPGSAIPTTRPAGAKTYLPCYRGRPKLTYLFDLIAFQQEKKLSKTLWRGVSEPMPGPAISRILENIDFCSRTSRKCETDMISKPGFPGIFSGGLLAIH